MSPLCRDRRESTHMSGTAGGQNNEIKQSCSSQAGEAQEHLGLVDVEPKAIALFSTQKEFDRVCDN